MFFLNKIVIFIAIFAGHVSVSHADNRSIKIYVASAEVTMNEVRGTSRQLNLLIDSWANSTGGLRSGLSRWSGPGFTGTIKVYTNHNIDFVHNNCNYKRYPLKCGVRNLHWTVLTHVHVGDKFSILNSRLYDEKGDQIASAQITSWGEVRRVPQWKYTKIKETGGWHGPQETEIYEHMPPKIEELPPLIKPIHVHQVISLMYNAYRPPGK